MHFTYDPFFIEAQRILRDERINPTLPYIPLSDCIQVLPKPWWNRRKGGAVTTGPGCQGALGDLLCFQCFGQGVTWEQSLSRLGWT